MPIVLPITLVAAASAALINLWLAIRCGQVRTAHKISMGDGGNDAMIAAMRAHANFVENTPFVLVLVAALELAVGSAIWLWIVVALYMIGRILHGLGMTAGHRGRMIGTITTMLTLLGLAGMAIAIPYLTPKAVEIHEAPRQG